MGDAAFDAWLDDLRVEAARVYRSFEVVPEHWRDEFERGVTAGEAFWRIMDAVFEPTAEEVAAFGRRGGAPLQ